MDIIRGDDCDFELTFKDVDGNLIDLTDATIFFTVKRNKDDSDDDALISTELTNIDDPELGIAILSLSDTETDLNARAYHFDIQLKDSAGKISSTYAGRFIVTGDITLRIS